MTTFDPGYGDFLVIDGNIVERDALRIAEKVQDYDPDLFLTCLDPEAFSAVTDAPFVVFRRLPDGRCEKVLEAWILDDQIIERIWLSDGQRNNQQKILDDLVAAEKKKQEAAWQDRLGDAGEKLVAAIKNPSSSFSIHNEEGDLVKIHESKPPTYNNDKKSF